MDLRDLEMLAAASLLAGSIYTRKDHTHVTPPVHFPSNAEIKAAVETARRIWTVCGDSE